jgi:ankyrin repeat protein
MQKSPDTKQIKLDNGTAVATTQQESIDLSGLPLDVVGIIASHLPLSAFPNYSRANKRFHTLFQGPAFWKRKLQRHFPRVSHKNISDWAKAFNDAENGAYHSLPANVRQLFRYAKDNNNDAIFKQHVDIMQLLLADATGNTLCLVAAEQNNQELLNYFYKIILNFYQCFEKFPYGFDIDRNSPLHWAIRCRQPLETITSLIQQRDDVNQRNGKGRTPLDLAAQNGDAAAIQLLIENGATVNHARVKVGDIPGDASPLYLAAKHGHAACVQVLLDNDASINHLANENNTPLTTAVLYNHTECVKVLVGRGADVNIAGFLSHTALMHAAEQGNHQCLALLIQAKANVNAIAALGTTALHLAAQHGHLECIRLLMMNGADTNALNCNGVDSALILAAEHRHPDCISLLLSSDTRPPQQDLDVALFHAAFFGLTENVRQLLEHGANPEETLNSHEASLQLHTSSRAAEAKNNLQVYFESQQRRPGF